MFKVVHQLLIILCLRLTLIDSMNVSLCISNTPCNCEFPNYSFELTNCWRSLPNLPILDQNITINTTKIIAQNAFSHWPTRVCNYSNVKSLDFSNSNFHSQTIDLTCLYQLIHLNLSQTQLTAIPIIRRTVQILDLSNNQIENLDGNSFRLLHNLSELYLQNNPLKQIYHLEYLLGLSQLQFLNLKSSNNLTTTIRKSLTINQWINLAYRWKKANKTLEIRTNTISLQSIFPSNSNQFQLISSDLLKIIFQTLANSTFVTLFSTPKCNCKDLRNYQRVFSLINANENQWPLFRTSTCLMPNGFIYASLFDHRTLTDLHCVIRGKNISDSGSVLDYHLVIYLLLFYLF